ncbi:MAG: aminotransferase class III-fold pyridoxal phosphate-dependent enzyme [Balneolaceae bacterium]
MHKNIWHPFSNLAENQPPLNVKSAQGLHLTLENGQVLMDCCSSDGFNLHGHAQPDIAKAIYEQALQLDRPLSAEFVNQLAEQLADLITAELPKILNRLVFASNEVSAVENGMKLALQYWRNNGQKRNTFICFEGANKNAASSLNTINNNALDNSVFDIEVIPFPDSWIDDANRAKKEDAIIDQLELMLDEHPEKYAGIIIEPLVQVDGGVRICSEEFMQKVHWSNRQFDTLLIFDETSTGFGRTGDYFACKRAQVEPDITCLGQGLTAGFTPLSATVCSDELYETINKTDMYSKLWKEAGFAANPLACAAGIASWMVLKQYETTIKNLEGWHLKFIEHIKENPQLEKFRVKGSIAAFDVNTENSLENSHQKEEHIKKQGLRNDLLLQPIGNVLYLMPPYCTTESELEQIYSSLNKIKF